jgi:hypothetical protein
MTTLFAELRPCQGLERAGDEPLGGRRSRRPFKSDAGIRQVPLAPLVVEAIRRQLPPGSDPDDLVFTGPGGGGPGVPRGTRTVLSRHNLHRTYQGALAKLADPAVPLRPTARRILLILRDGGPQRLDQLAA